MVPFLEGDSFIFGVDCFVCPKRKYIKRLIFQLPTSGNFQVLGLVSLGGEALRVETANSTPPEI